jgi:hypothetical protein
MYASSSSGRGAPDEPEGSWLAGRIAYGWMRVTVIADMLTPEMSELDLLRVLLLVSMALGPLGTHRHFLGLSPLHVAAHVVALGCAATGLLWPAPLLCVPWLLFTATSFGLFLRSRLASLGSPRVLAACVPFLFSNVAAVWLVSGSNDLHLLGYGMNFSFYAALHGNVLGWIVMGALAILVDKEDLESTPYLPALFICFASFLLIALGIDQLHALKKIGVVGLSVALPLAQLTFLRSVWGRDRAAFALGALSFAGLVFTMVLAWGNELALRLLDDVLGIRAIVSVHGVLNAIVIAPCFLLAVALAHPVRPHGPSAAR